MSRLPCHCDDRANESTALIHEVLRIIQDIARILKNEHTDDDEFHEFYGDLRAYCLMITDDHMQRIARNGICLPYDLTDPITKRIGAIITSTAPFEKRLRELYDGWTEVQVKSDEVKINFIRSTLAFGDRQERRDMMEFLKQWEKEVQSRYPEDRSSWARDELAPQRKFDKPSFAVGIAAEDTFKALIACQKCECLPVHDFGVRLGLGTYRKPKGNDLNDEEIDFDMFLSAKEDWQEVRVHTTREVVVRIAVKGQAAPEPPGYPAAQCAPVKRLCKSIDKARRVMAADYRLELKVMQGRLYKLQSKRSNVQVDPTQRPVTLHEFLQGGPRAFTDKTKRILSVLLGYAVLHLQDTPWLKPTWSSSTILFFRTSALQIPLRPFLQTNISGTFDEEGLKADGRQQSQYFGDSDEDEVDPDDLMAHPFPTIVILAITLMEIYFVTPFSELAKRFNIPVEANVSNLVKFLNAWAVFRACEDHMPENSQFLHAIQKCLDPKVWQDEYGNRLGIQDLRGRLYDEVIEPLENDLSMAYSSISIEKLDQVVQKLDMSRWAQVIRQQPVQGLDLWKYLIPNRRGPSLIPSRLGTPLDELTPSPSHPYYRSGDQGLKFFDDETPSDGHSPQACQRYLRWKSDYRSTYNKFISDDCITPSLASVKIAILDTGVDLNHPDMQACGERIKAKLSWRRDGVRTTVHDLDGHGTFITSLLLDYAPDADIYVAKIFDREPANPLIISNAIYHAVDVWKVDIISMSFGFPAGNNDGYGDLERSINHACLRDVLLFAAASNNGAQHGRSYPARDSNVVCVNSVNVNGNRSAFSPTAPPEETSLATVGEAIESAWPMDSSSADEEATITAVKSGTSYATPIMAGIAAFLLTYARLNLPEKAHKLRRRSRMVQLMRRIALKDDGGIRDGYHFVDIRLHPDSLFGKDKEFIDRTIGDILDG
ncbi:hypothetical protein PG985_003282 [Apiospora marii]|uniref:Peptidase S8/S53 domain-containing protein n=1 Tax=Apiospora marii TaxID=335849 RepID=A0ABR1RV45_9PEZI